MVGRRFFLLCFCLPIFRRYSLVSGRASQLRSGCLKLQSKDMARELRVSWIFGGPMDDGERVWIYTQKKLLDIGICICHLFIVCMHISANMRVYMGAHCTFLAPPPPPWYGPPPYPAVLAATVVVLDSWPPYVRKIYPLASFWLNSSAFHWDVW